MDVYLVRFKITFVKLYIYMYIIEGKIIVSFIITFTFLEK